MFEEYANLMSNLLNFWKLTQSIHFSETDRKDSESLTYKDKDIASREFNKS